MLRPALFATSLLVLSGAQAAEMRMNHGAQAGKATPSDKAYEAAMTKMMTTMDVKPSGAPDKDFVAMMLPHHQGAVDMAEVELKFGKDPALLAMARAIVEAQTKEMAEMRAWQAKHGQ